MLEWDRCKITKDLAVENYFAHLIGINSEGAFLFSIFMHWSFHEIYEKFMQRDDVENAIPKGSLISERFSLKSPKKSAKSLRWALFNKKLRIIILHTIT